MRCVGGSPTICPALCCHHLWKEPVNAIHCGEKCDILYTFTQWRHIHTYLHKYTHICTYTFTQFHIQNRLQTFSQITFTFLILYVHFKNILFFSRFLQSTQYLFSMQMKLKVGKSTLKALIEDKLPPHWSVHTRKSSKLFLKCPLLPRPPKSEQERNPMDARCAPTHTLVLLVWNSIYMLVDTGEKQW